MGFQRIISLAPSNTEIVFSLGMGNQLVGVTEYCNYPPEAKLIEKIGGFSTPDIEKILSLSPDLVLAMNFHEGMGVPQRLGSKGIHFCLLSSESIFKAPQNIIEIGKILGCLEKALSMAKKIEQRMRDVLDIAARAFHRTRVCYLCDIGCTAWRSCHMSKLIELLGGINVAGNMEGADKESIIEGVCLQDPEVIVFSQGHMGSEDLLSFVMQNPHFKKTKAYKENRIYGMRAELICRPGPRAAEGLETLARFIHPETFEE